MNASKTTVMVCLLAIAYLPARGATTFYYDRASWAADLASRGMTNLDFPFTASNLEKSDELTSPPTSNTQLGPVLTFQSVATELPFGFKLTATNPDSSLVFQPTAGYSYGPNALAIDNETGSESPNDDWQVTVTGGVVLAFGADVIDNGWNIDESFQVFGAGNVLLGSAATPLTPEGVPFPDSRFIGVISDDPIERIFFEANPSPGTPPGTGDNIGLKNFAFPEPATIMMLALAGAGIIRRRKA